MINKIIKKLKELQKLSTSKASDRLETFAKYQNVDVRFFADGTIILEDGFGNEVIDTKDPAKVLATLTAMVDKVGSIKEVKLNEDYTAIVNKNSVTVGCQIFPMSKIREIVKLADSIVDK